jgi:hypothetical protein
MFEPTATESWKIERSGTFEDYEIVGWRYSELAVWHIKAWLKGSNGSATTYLVAAGEFYPSRIDRSERFAIMRMLSLWETVDGVYRNEVLARTSRGIA